ncbi:host specificity factor TipJ family phage tail protein [Methylobacterium sp. sgz302541]|uniref:host specificity factor TipJ family phage tail protein n=1 Tax=unclassified Methylobacterium TaxID=2615210 RepID=UPI003D3293BE
MSSSVFVVAQPSCLDVLFGRVEAQVDPGATIAEMIARLLPQATGELRSRLRVTLGEHVLLPGLWHAIRPKPGACVLIRAVPGNDVLRNVLTIAVAVSAVALGQFYAPALAGSLLGLPGAATGGLTSALSAAITGSTLIAGTLLINALVPVRADDKDKPVYAIQGLRNQLTPGGAVPLILGFVRYAPPYAAKPYTQAVGDYRYVVAAFCCGYGPLAMRNWQIGDTPIERYADVQIETRSGLPGDERLTLYPAQVVEEPLSVELLTAVLPTGGEQIRTTAADCTGCEIDTTYPAGVYGKSRDGANVTFTVVVTTRYRLSGAGDDAWIVGPTIAVTSKKAKAIVRTTPITFPARGRWEVGLTRITTDWDEADQSRRDTQYSGRSSWTALRSLRPEYPLNFDKPLALAGCRIRATGQLNGTLDQLNAEMRSICPDWDSASGQWVARETNNPASLFRYVLTGPAISYPLAADEIAALGDWHAFNVAKGLTYNRAHDYEASVLDVLSDIAAAGRASPQDTGTAWGVVIDRALTFVSAHISPRNSWGFQGERPYTVFPDAFRVSFLDETNSFKQAERVVPWPGFEGAPVVVEKLDLPGVTSPAMIWKEARRRQYELKLRRDTYTVSQDFEALTSARGDLVRLSHDVLDRAQVAARVTAVVGNRVTLDEPVAFENGQSYACRFRRNDGSSLLRQVSGVGETQTVILVGAGDGPQVGNLAFFGAATQESFACIIKGVEGMENLTARLTLVDHAPEIEALVDAEVPPPWSGRAGSEAQQPVGTPQAPLILDIVSGRQASGQATDDNPYPVLVLVQAAAGETVPIAGFDARHRTLGASAWTQETAPASAGSVSIDGYTTADKGTQVEIQARAVASRGTPGPWTGIVVHTIAATDPPAPTAPTNLSLSTPASGLIRVTVTSSASAQTATTQIYLATGAGATLASAHKVGGPINGGPNTPLTFDATGLTAGTVYRVWATSSDADAPPNESVPAGPANATVG